jgi:hypothetical protein
MEFSKNAVASFLRPALRPEDGARFYAQIDLVDTGQFRVTCWADLDHGASVETEAPSHRMFMTEEGARVWINQ